MTTANVVDVSEWQPTTIDFDNLKQQGVKAVIVRLGHGITQDPHAASHIARASAVGLRIHGYHFYEGKDGEVAWSLKNAKELGLATTSYYFLDMEGKIKGSWADIFRGFYRNWLQAGYKAGLYCSLSKYGLFNDQELTSNHIYKWIADWDVDQAPGIADIWQYNCSTGLGNYQDKLDKDVDISGKLVATVEKPISHTTDPDKIYKVKAGAFVNFDYPTTSLMGGKMLVSSPDGINKIPKLGPDGLFIFNAGDFDNIWADMKKRIHLPSITDDVALKSDLAAYVKRDELPDLSNYATHDELDHVKAQKGDPGKNGDSAYQIAVKHGFVGSEDDWLKSLHGKDGKNSQGGTESADSLSAQAVADQLQQHLKAHLDPATGQLSISFDDVTDGSLIDAIAVNLGKRLTFKLDNGNLVVHEEV